MCESLEVNKQTHTHNVILCTKQSTPLGPQTSTKYHYIGGDYVTIGDEIEI
jgi:hypothetical protein